MSYSGVGERKFIGQNLSDLLCESGEFIRASGVATIDVKVEDLAIPGIHTPMWKVAVEWEVLAEEEEVLAGMFAY